VALRDSAIANHVYRIAQEAVINAIKGGQASQVNLRLFYRGDHVMLVVADNGIGFESGPIRKGMGLKLMEYRARVINGTLRFTSRPTGGTLMSCSFPI
jgi:signal transduction histidine kinase